MTNDHLTPKQRISRILDAAIYCIEKEWIRTLRRELSEQASSEDFDITELEKMSHMFIQSLTGILHTHLEAAAEEDYRRFRQIPINK